MAKQIIIETSARHIHISDQHLNELFGQGYILTNIKNLSQPGQFACEEKVTVIGPKNKMNVTILGPVRKNTQVELSMTDARILGISAPVRESGDIANSASVTISGPKGSVVISEGVIIAKRHIHLTPKEAIEFSVSDKQIVFVRVNTGERTIVFGDVVVRVSSEFSAVMHIDTDEANAGGIKGIVYGEIVEI